MINTVSSHLYMELKKKIQLTETETRMVVARDYRLGRWGDVGQRGNTFNYKFQGSKAQWLQMTVSYHKVYGDHS